MFYLSKYFEGNIFTRRYSLRVVVGWIRDVSQFSTKNGLFGRCSEGLLRLILSLVILWLVGSL